jgi:bifunctional non-homologous end joining protein LigD
MAGAPKEIETVPVTESDGERVEYLTVRAPIGIIACAQISALEFHLWGSRNDELEKPDRLVFDLDPDEALDFAQVKRAAFDIKALLDSADLPSFAMLTGGKGIHIVLHLKRKHSWDEVKGVSGGVAAMIAGPDPQRFVTTMTKPKRTGRIFVDYFRNHRGSTAIAPYSPRARAMAPIAAPVSWNELRTIPAASAFKLKDMRARLAEPDPWSAYADCAVQITKAARVKLGLN